MNYVLIPTNSTNLNHAINIKININSCIIQNIIKLLNKNCFIFDIMRIILNSVSIHALHTVQTNIQNRCKQHELISYSKKNYLSNEKQKNPKYCHEI